jgi:hypothetical protein
MAFRIALKNGGELVAIINSLLRIDLMATKKSVAFFIKNLGLVSPKCRAIVSLLLLNLDTRFTIIDKTSPLIWLKIKMKLFSSKN